MLTDEKLQHYLNTHGLDLVEIASARIDRDLGHYAKRVELRVRWPQRQYIRSAAHSSGWHFATHKALIRLVEDLQRLALGAAHGDIFSYTNMSAHSAAEVLRELDIRANGGGADG